MVLKRFIKNYLVFNLLNSFFITHLNIVSRSLQVSIVNFWWQILYFVFYILIFTVILNNPKRNPHLYYYFLLPTHWTISTPIQPMEGEGGGRGGGKIGQDWGMGGEGRAIHPSSTADCYLSFRKMRNSKWSNV